MEVNQAWMGTFHNTLAIYNTITKKNIYVLDHTYTKKYTVFSKILLSIHKFF